MSGDYEMGSRDLLKLVAEKEDLLIDGGGRDETYDFYRHAGIGVGQIRGAGDEENPPADFRSNLP
jgi:NADH-quinone oxidoreductase subunit I